MTRDELEVALTAFKEAGDEQIDEVRTRILDENDRVSAEVTEANNRAAEASDRADKAEAKARELSDTLIKRFMGMEYVDEIKVPPEAPEGRSITFESLFKAD